MNFLFLQRRADIRRHILMSKVDTRTERIKYLQSL